MERSLFDALYALGAAGADHLWGLLQHERAAWAEKQLSWEREHASWERERASWERERALLLGKQDMIADREADAVAALQHKLDVARGHATARSVLEQIGKAAYPDEKTATVAINRVCNEPKFNAYLDEVSAAMHLSKETLLKSAKGAYGALSETIHSGSTISKAIDVIPEDVMNGKAMLVAVAALFKYARRDVRFYLDLPANELKLPSPGRTPTATSPAPSAATTPPKAPAGADVALAATATHAAAPAAPVAAPAAPDAAPAAPAAAPAATGTV